VGAPDLGGSRYLSDLNHRVGGDDQPIPLLVAISPFLAYLGQVPTIGNDAFDVAAALAAVEGSSVYWSTDSLVRGIVV